MKISLLIVVSLIILAGCNNDTSSQSNAFEKYNENKLHTEEMFFKSLKNKDFKEVFIIADSCIKALPDSTLGYYFRGLGYMESGKTSEAISDFTKAITINSELAAFYYYRGKCLLKTGEKDRSFLDIYKAQQIDTSRAIMAATHEFLKANFSEEYIQSKWDSIAGIRVIVSYNTIGLKEGRCEKFYQNGELCESSYYKNGKLHGLQRIYDQNGVLISERRYKDGVENGISRDWHANGKLSSEMNYENGQLNGRVTVWNEAGVIRTQGKYKNGELDGETITWNEVQKKYIKEIYVNGIRVN